VRYVSHKSDQTPLRLRIRDLAVARVRYGYFRIYILLRREGWLVNHKRVYRLYREDGLSLRLKRPRRNVSAAIRYAQQHGTRRPWLVQLLARRPTKVAAVALANKNARMVWALMTSGERYREPMPMAAAR